MVGRCWRILISSSHLPACLKVDSKGVVVGYGGNMATHAPSLCELQNRVCCGLQMLIRRWMDTNKNKRTNKWMVIVESSMWRLHEGELDQMQAPISYTNSR